MKSVLVVAVAVLATLCAAAAPARGQSLEIAQGAGGAPVGGARAVSATIETLAVHATVEEGVALVDIDQTFRNPTAAVLEGVWTIRLPEDAVVHTFSMWMEGREKQGRVLEAKAARQVYDSIVRQRKDPALLEETGWRTFRVSVFPIPAKDTVRVRLRYAYVVPDDLGLHTLALPLPADGAEIAALDVAIDVKSSSGLAAFDAPGRADARIERTPTGGTLRWSAERTRATGPFVTRFAAGGEGFSLALLAHRDVAVTSGDGGDAVGDGREGHFLVRVVPHLATVPDLPRDVVFVVDRSGSMQGKKMDQARAALVNGIATLRAVDRFGIVSFASDVHSLGGDALVPASTEWLDRARADAAALDASGGTNISGALDAAQALRPADADPNRLFVVVLLTDGDPTVGETNPDAILRAWKARSGGRTRLFALGVGADVKDFLLSRLAEGSRGAAQYVAADADLEVKLSSLFERMRTPLLVDPEITVSGVVTRSVEPQPLPDVFRGGAVVLAGRYRVGGPAEIVLRGRSGGAPVELRFPVVFEKAPIARPHVAQIWARMRIDRLLDDLRASDGNRGAHAEIRQEIIDLGVRYQVVSPYTSFLVVEDGVHVPDSRELARVPDAPPASGPTADDRGQPTGSGAHALGRGSGTKVRTATDAQGPGGEVPPDSREPNDPPPVADGGGPGTPAGNDPGGPTTGGGGGGPPPSGGGGEPAPTGGGGGGPSTGAAPEAEFADWYAWWRFESPALLADKMAAVTPPLAHDVVDAQLLPSIQRIADDAAENFFVRAAAIEALVKLRDEGAATRNLIARLQVQDLRAHRVVVERAILAPVWMDDHSEATRARLIGVLRTKNTATFARPYAAVTLGLLGDKDHGRVATELLAYADDATSEDARPAAYLALGLLGDRSAVAPMAATLGDRAAKLSDVERAWLISALGRLGDAGDLDASGRPHVSRILCALVAADMDGVVPRRAAPRALAALHAAVDDAERGRIVAVLTGALDDANASVRNEAALALGRVAGAPEGTPERRRSIIRRLAKARKDAASDDFARVGLGYTALGPERKLALAALHDLMFLKDSPRAGGAACAWAIASDRDAAPALLRWIAPRSAPRVVGMSLVALAEIGAPEAADVVRSVLADANANRDILVPAAFAAAITGDKRAVPLLRGVMESDEESEWILAAAADALGCLGDAATAERMLAIAEDERKWPDLTRGLALRAVGRMGSRRPDPLVRICDGFLYRAWVPALGELHAIVSGRR